MERPPIADAARWPREEDGGRATGVVGWFYYALLMLLIRFHRALLSLVGRATTAGRRALLRTQSVDPRRPQRQ